MTWKRTARWSWFALPFLLLAVWPGVAAADGPKGVRPDANGVLYEAIENLLFDPGTGGVFRVSALQGSVSVGTPLCPYAVFVTNPKAQTCTVTVFGERELVTEAVTGTFAVVVEGPAVGAPNTNPVDSPEFVVMMGDFTGSIILPTGSPVGVVTGTFEILGGPTLNFVGTVRLPIAMSASGNHEKPRRGHDAFYVNDKGRLVPVGKNEYALGYPTVRIELNVTGP